MSVKFIGWEDEELGAPKISIAKCCGTCEHAGSRYGHGFTVYCEKYRSIGETIDYHGDTFYHAYNYHVSSVLVCESWEQRHNLVPKKLSGWRESD